jgi:hypothetical protein
LEGLKHYMLEQDEQEMTHGGLRGLGRRGVIPYIHRERVVLLCVWCCLILSRTCLKELDWSCRLPDLL